MSPATIWLSAFSSAYFSTSIYVFVVHTCSFFPSPSWPAKKSDIPCCPAAGRHIIVVCTIYRVCVCVGRKARQDFSVTWFTPPTFFCCVARLLSVMVDEGAPPCVGNQQVYHHEQSHTQLAPCKIITSNIFFILFNNFLDDEIVPVLGRHKLLRNRPNRFWFFFLLSDFKIPRLKFKKICFLKINKFF